MLHYDTVNRLIANRIKEIGRDSKIIIDGFPRTVEQTHWFADNYAKDVIANFNFQLPSEKLIRRLIKRGRNDDKIETIPTRLDIFNNSQQNINEVLKKHNINTVLH